MSANPPIKPPRLVVSVQPDTTTRLDWARQLLSAAQAKNFYGKITFHLHDGVIQQATEERSLKPPT